MTTTVTQSDHIGDTTEMVFTDADLARMKAQLHPRGGDDDMIWALLDRLAAAEAFLKAPNRELNYQEILEWRQWREVAGK